MNNWSNIGLQLVVLCFSISLLIMWMLLAVVYVAGFSEYEKEISNWYWIFSMVIMTGSCHYVFYVIYHGTKKCFRFGNYREVNNESHEGNSNRDEVELEQGGRQLYEERSESLPKPGCCKLISQKVSLEFKDKWNWSFIFFKVFFLYIF